MGNIITGNWMYAPRIKYSNKTLVLMTSSSEAHNINTHKFVSIIVDVNGDKGESIIGKDAFYLTLFADVPCPNNTKPEGLHFGTLQPGDRCGTYQLNNTNLLRLTGGYGCTDKNRDGGRSCGLLIQRNSWKVPSYYPVKF